MRPSSCQEKISGSQNTISSSHEEVAAVVVEAEAEGGARQRIIVGDAPRVELGFEDSPMTTTEASAGDDVVVRRGGGRG
jgi:hypothetical protein